MKPFKGKVRLTTIVLGPGPVRMDEIEKPKGDEKCSGKKG